MFSLKNLAKCKNTVLSFVAFSFVNYSYFEYKYKMSPLLVRNQINNRIDSQVLVSNNPCEDRHAVKQLQAVNGYAIGVYDGHGGWQVSHYASKVLLEFLQQSLKENRDKIFNNDELIITAIKQAFRRTQENFVLAALTGYQFGFGRMARAGSCSIVTVVANNKVYTGNAGDSAGILISENQQKMSFKQLNRQLNANNPDERQRLKTLFPDQPDIVICKRENTSCYVKGRLQPTRSLGDLRLKYKQFNNPQNYSRQHDYQPQLTAFTGPYITYQPQISIFELKQTDKAIVVASDGLWDQLTRQEVANLFKNKSVQGMAGQLIQKALQRTSKINEIPVEKIKDIPVGKKRHIHDDITVVVIDLQKQTV